MYALFYFYPETVTVEEYFSDTKIFFENSKKMSTPGPVSKHWLGFSFIRSEYYELDMKFYETELKIKSDHISNDEVKLFCEILWSLRKNFFWYKFNWWCNLSNGRDQLFKIQNQPKQ